MKKIRKAVLSLMLATAMTTSAVPVMANAGDAKVQTVDLQQFVNELMEHNENNDHTYNISYNAVLSGLLEEYTELSNYKAPNDYWYPTLRQPFYHPVIKNNGDICVVNTYFTEIAVKVKENTELPLESIKANIEQANKEFPDISKNNNIYYIYELESKDTMDLVMDKIKACENVLSIDYHYATYYNKGATGKINKFLYYGTADADNIISSIPEFDLVADENKNTTSANSVFWIGEKRISDGFAICEAIKRLNSSDITFEIVPQITGGTTSTADIYYNGKSNTPLLIDGLNGDANVDGSTDLSDAVTVMQSLANPDKYNVSAQGSKNADTDGNGITNADALNIQKQLLGL